MKFKNIIIPTVLFLLLTTVLLHAQTDSIHKSDSRTFNQYKVVLPNDSTKQDSLNNLLFEAADKGSVDSVVDLLLKGANVNAKTSDGVTPLMFASQNGHLEVVKILLFNGADVNASPDDGATALIAATRFGHEDIMDTLIHHGALTNKRTDDSATALIYAASYGYYIPADMLIFYGTNVNIATKDSSTALILASWFGKKDIVELLINKGASLNAKDNNGWTALHCAVYKDYPDIVKLLVDKGASVNEKNSEGFTPLAIAGMTGDPEIADYLLNHGADASLKTNKKTTPYLMALYYHKKEFQKTLSKNKAKKELMPVFNNINISLAEFSMNNRDFMYGLNAGISDIRYNIGFNIGFDTRLWANRTLVPIDDKNYYQLWERRSFIYINVEKLIRISSPSHFQQGILIEGKGLYTYGKYVASITKPDNIFLFSPGIGYSIFDHGVGVKLYFEYLDLKIKDMTPVRLNLGIFFIIERKKYFLSPKDTEWL
jgi:ankyrin repeat protein